MGVKIQNLDRLKAKLDRFPGAAEKAIGFGIKDSAVRIQNGARRRVPVDRGTLRNETTHEMGPKDQSARVGTNQPHGASVEFGSRPHWPPMQPIIEWVGRHWRDFGLATASGKSRSKSAATMATQKSIAYLIARKISRHGTPAKPFLFPAFMEEVPHVKERIARELNKALKALAAGTATPSAPPTEGVAE